MNRLIEAYEGDLKKIKEDGDQFNQNQSKINDLSNSIKSDKLKLEELDQDLRKAQKYELIEDDLLGIGFLNPSDKERELLALRKLVLAKAKFLLKMRDLVTLFSAYGCPKKNQS